MKINLDDVWKLVQVLKELRNYPALKALHDKALQDLHDLQDQVAPPPKPEPVAKPPIYPPGTVTERPTSESIPRLKEPSNG